MQIASAMTLLLAIAVTGLFLSCGDSSTTRQRKTQAPYHPDPNADYRGGPFFGQYEIVNRITLPSGAWIETRDPFEAVVAAARTVDYTFYDRTFHKHHDPAPMPFEVVQRQQGAPTAVYYYDVGGMLYRVVVDRQRGPGLVERLDLYENATIRDDAYADRRSASESPDVYNRRRASGRWIGNP